MILAAHVESKISFMRGRCETVALEDTATLMLFAERDWTNFTHRNGQLGPQRPKPLDLKFCNPPSPNAASVVS